MLQGYSSYPLLFGLHRSVTGGNSLLIKQPALETSSLIVLLKAVAVPYGLLSNLFLIQIIEK
ncbi:hypothetical protein [Candidatus Cardinium hertigii]|uniref:Uncharacterized protein n=1 Tax=Candidatus Cardinium hertigii TaxID=247481 RepID=A0A2Z3LH65_9BACT|nr:hypothetical protein [Candidatus Cardinium hertigii]AWN81855.1 hypothetical protein DK880_00535 [Candidatus Cardinium hertigii]